ncbi:MAG: hypothetical protein MZV64_67185 [Ignavibacteriales bacterium]|nr:hypothetical protein [Ignavibacteriales bacterium]
MIQAIISLVIISIILWKSEQKKIFRLLHPFIRDSLKNVEVIKEFRLRSEEKEWYKIFNFELCNFIIMILLQLQFLRLLFRYKDSGSDEEKVVLSNPVTFTVHTVQVEQQAEIKGC